LRLIAAAVALVDLAGRDLDIENDPAEVVHHPVLLVARLEATVPSGRRHGRIGVGEADLL
jgi:hypothetical protein